MLISLDERLNQIDRRFDLIEKRISELREDMNKRFEMQDRRFEEQNRRFDEIIQLMMAMVGAFATIVAVTIGFAMWDWLTMIRKARDEAVEGIEKKRIIRDILEAIRAYGKKNPEFGEILQSFHLL